MKNNRRKLTIVLTGFLMLFGIQVSAAHDNPSGPGLTIQLRMPAIPTSGPGKTAAEDGISELPNTKLWLTRSAGEQPLVRWAGVDPIPDSLTVVPPLQLGGDPSTPPSVSVPAPAAGRDTSFWQHPTGKLFKSVIFPGWGQYANGKYQKAAIFFTMETYFIVRAIHFFGKTRDEYDRFILTEERVDFNAYDNARKTRDKFYWFVAGTIFISMWDAYADAHIKPFEETKDRGDEFWGWDNNPPDLGPPPFNLALTFKF